MSESGVYIEYLPFFSIYFAIKLGYEELKSSNNPEIKCNNDFIFPGKCIYPRFSGKILPGFYLARAI